MAHLPADSQGASRLVAEVLYAGEDVPSPAYESWIPVVFPSGRRGLAVLYGFHGPYTGVRALFRQEADHVSLVDATFDWISWRQVQKDATRLGPPARELGTILRMVGETHGGTGLFTEGHFQLVAITDSGFHLLFEGIEKDGFPAGGQRWRWMTFQRTDPDADGIDEILATGEDCRHPPAEPGSLHLDYDSRSCEQLSIVYRYNGSYYVAEGK